MDKILKYVLPIVSAVAGAAGYVSGALTEEQAGAIVVAGITPLGFAAFGPQIMAVLKSFKKEPAKPEQPTPAKPVGK